MTVLLDVNLLIAIIDPLHIHHRLALAWFEREGGRSWATCPIVQNGVIRIVGGTNYSNVPLDCGEVAGILAEWCSLPEHCFWADDISILEHSLVDRAKIGSARRVTDIYLLALAVANGARLATLDRKLSTIAVNGGAEALHVIA